MTAFGVSPDRLRWRCASSLIPFECTSDMIPLADFIGPERTIREHRIEEPASFFGWLPPQGLRPEPIPTQGTDWRSGSSGTPLQFDNSDATP